MDFFPKDTPRPSQTVVIHEVAKAFSEGKKIVILEGPVGCGKSAIAMTLALYQAHLGSMTVKADDGEEVVYDPVHILTPRKNLQDQYYSDFKDSVSLMKGRGSYPCIFNAEPRVYQPILKAVEAGSARVPSGWENTCADGPCKDSADIYKSCTSNHPCPYSLAINVAQNSPIVVHNLHSFLFQTNFSGKFSKRRLMIIDEAHDVPGIVRDFAIKSLKVPAKIERKDLEGKDSAISLADFLSQEKFVPVETEFELAKKRRDESYVTEKQQYLMQLEAIKAQADGYFKEFSVELEPKFKGFTTEQIATILRFIPHSVGNLVQKLLLDHGMKTLLMSGTIYSKTQYCREMGINPDDAYFIRIPSAFPVKNRPIYMLPRQMVDTSHKGWAENFPKMIESIKEVMSIFGQDKGLIHAPSYGAAVQIAEALKSQRVITHEPANFHNELTAFFNSRGNGVFISPVCQQGVDFKGERARFQIILRVPYPNAGSAFVADKLKKDFSWFNYQALIVFGQQVGRVNRGPDDFGATFLLDSRFPGFIQKNKGLLPKWLTDAIIQK